MSGLLQIDEPIQRGLAVGIDLGTTHSLIAAAGGEKVAVPIDERGGRLLPSVVHYAANGRVLVGREALARAGSEPIATVVSAKRYMGRDLQELTDAERAARAFMAPDGPGPAGEGRGPVRFDVGGGRGVTAIEVSAEILRALVARGEAKLGTRIERAVITVPAWFDDAQRQATRDAGRLAGLEVLRIINEPTAAALAYGLEARVNGRFAIYDLGGGTFDLSLLLLDDGLFQVMATKGDTALGGDDFDEALLRHLLAAHPEAADEPLSHRARLMAVRAAREALTGSERCEVTFGARSYPLSRGEYEALPEVRALVERTLRIARQALADAKVRPSEIDGVVLVGGMTRTPLVRREVERLFGKVPLTSLDPDQVVVLGAAAQAHQLASGGEDGHLLLDVNPLSLGLETMGGVVERLIPRNSSIPASVTQLFTTYKDGQSGLDLHVVQGERELARDCRSLARFQLKGLPPLAAGMARIEVTFAVDADGILSVSALEQSTGLAQAIKVHPAHGLSDEEIERLLLDAIDHAEEDVKGRFLQEAKVDAGRIVDEARKRLADHAFLLEEGERESIEIALDALASACTTDDARMIAAFKEQLVLLTNPFAERLMSYEVQRAVRGLTVT